VDLEIINIIKEKINLEKLLRKNFWEKHLIYKNEKYLLEKKNFTHIGNAVCVKVLVIKFL
jgi:hypothetical protein